MRCPGVRRREVLDAHAMRSGLYYVQDAACTVVHNNVHAGQCLIQNHHFRMVGDQCWMLRDCTAELQNVTFTGGTLVVSGSTYAHMKYVCLYDCTLLILDGARVDILELKSFRVNGVSVFVHGAHTNVYLADSEITGGGMGLVVCQGAELQVERVSLALIWNCAVESRDLGSRMCLRDCKIDRFSPPFLHLLLKMFSVPLAHQEIDSPPRRADELTTMIGVAVRESSACLTDDVTIQGADVAMLSGNTEQCTQASREVGLTFNAAKNTMHNMRRHLHPFWLGKKELHKRSLVQANNCTLFDSTALAVAACGPGACVSVYASEFRPSGDQRKWVEQEGGRVSLWALYELCSAIPWDPPEDPSATPEMEGEGRSPQEHDELFEDQLKNYVRYWTWVRGSMCWWLPPCVAELLRPPKLVPMPLYVLHKRLWHVGAYRPVYILHTRLWHVGAYGFLGEVLCAASMRYMIFQLIPRRYW